MALPFVRDLFADVEKLPAFTRVVSHLRANTGRIGVSGPNSSAKALLIPQLQKVLGRPVIVVTRNNEAADELLPVIQAFSELVGGQPADAIVSLPTRDVLPFQNLSPHPEIQEERAVALWKIATGMATIVVAPVTSTATRLRGPEYYADLARIVRRTESIDVHQLFPHRITV